MFKQETEIAPFKYETKLHICDILKNTKNLIKCTTKYCNYMQKYTYFTQSSTFKLPEITSYPILKNNELIPLSKTTFDFFRPKTNKILLGETGAKFYSQKQISETIPSLNKDFNSRNKGKMNIIQSHTENFNLNIDVYHNPKDTSALK